MKKSILFLIIIFQISLARSQPTGSVLAYAGEIDLVESGNVYLNCDGRLLRIKDYPELFKAIGWAYLKKSDTINRNYFRLPDYQGYFLRGVDTTQTIDKGSSLRKSAQGNIVGAFVGSIEDEAFKAHSHGVTDPGHNHSMRDDNLSNGRKNFSGAEVTTFDGGQAPKPNQTTGITIQDSGNEETRPINISVYWIIKVN